MSNAMHITNIIIASSNIIIIIFIVIGIVAVVNNDKKTLWHLSNASLDTRQLRPGIFLIASLAFWPSQRYPSQLDVL